MLEGFLASIDMIGVPVALNLSGKQHSRTTFGGLCSLFFYGFAIWTIGFCSKDFFSTLNPRISSYEHYNSDPIPLTLDYKSFPIGFQMRAPDSLNYTSYQDESIFRVEIYHNLRQNILLPNGSRSTLWTTSRVYLENCTLQHFQNQDIFLTSIDTDNAFCIAREQPDLAKLQIQGALSSRAYQEISVKIYVCDNITSNNTCASPDKINSYLTGGWLNVIYNNMIVNLQNYSSPNTVFKEVYRAMVSIADYRETEIELGHVQITTDKGWIMDEMGSNAYIKVNKVKESSRARPSSDTRLINFVFKMSNIESYHLRSYKKVQEVLAEIAGLGGSALFIIYVFTNGFFKLKFREKIMNELFDFQLPPPKNDNKKPKPKPLAKPEPRSKNKDTEYPDTEREENKATTDALQTMQTKMATNMNISQDQKTIDAFNLQSPLNSERPLISRAFRQNKKKRSSDSPQRRFNSPNQASGKSGVPMEIRLSPREQVLKKYTRSKTAAIVFDENEDKVSDTEAQVKRNYEAHHRAAIENLKSKLKDADLAHKAKQVESKPLGEENSLHLSFSSEGAKSEGDREENKEELQDIEIAVSEQKKDEINLESGNEDADVDNVDNADNAEMKNRLNNSITRERESSRLSEDKAKEFPMKLSPKSVGLSIWEYAMLFICRPSYLARKKEIYDEGITHVNERLDIVNVMKKLREIDKLRALLLDTDQLVLFNNLPKPEITKKNPDSVGKSSIANTLLQDSKFVENRMGKKQMLTSYNNLKSKPDKTEIDKRLIDIFEEKKFY